MPQLDGLVNFANVQLSRIWNVSGKGFFLPGYFRLSHRDGNRTCVYLPPLFSAHNVGGVFPCIYFIYILLPFYIIVFHWSVSPSFVLYKLKSRFRILQPISCWLCKQSHFFILMQKNNIRRLSNSMDWILPGFLAYTKTEVKYYKLDEAHS